jgi:ATP-dependent Clp protease ATP-binding subunit ClpC
MKMEETIHERIIGQKHAVISVSKAIRRARVGLRNPNRPIASFIFAGPTGVGKTELTKALSDYMFSTEESMIRLDMSEFMEKHTVAKLIGSPPGYVGYNEGGQLTEAVRSKPYSVVLFDEVEKAHPDVFNLLLQILDDGRLSDSKGRVIDFTNTLIVMTTNLGSKIIERESGIKSKSDQGDRGFKITPDAVLGWEPTPEPITDPKLFERTSSLVNEELKNFFRPEFLNRIDEIIVFNHLTRIDIWQICALMVKQVKTRLKEKDINLVVELAVQAFLTDEGYDPIYGARPLRRAIMKYLEDSLAEQCLSKTLYPNTKIIVRRKKVEGTLLTYTNELEVEVNFDDVDPNLLQEGNELVNQSSQLLTDSSSNQTSNVIDIDGEPNSTESKKPRRRLSRFFNKTKN